MTRIFAIAAREYNAVVRSKGFVISLVLLPLMMFGSIMVQRLSSKVQDVNDRHFAVIDRTPGGQIYPFLENDVERRNEFATLDPTTRSQIKPRFVLERIELADEASADRQRLELSERVRRGQLYGVLDIGKNVLGAVVPEWQQDPPPEQVVGYSTNNPTSIEFKELATSAIVRAVRNKRLLAAGVSKDEFEKLQTPARIVNRGLAQEDAAGAIVFAEAGRDIAAFLLPLGLVMLMFVVVIVGAVPLLQGIAEEKHGRISEVLLGSVSPFTLMAGKVLGLIATSSTLILFYLSGAYWAAHRAHMTEYLPGHLLAWFVVFQVLAVLMYGSLYIAIAACCNDPNQMQTLLMPVNLLMALPLIMIMPIMQSPSGPMSRIMTYFPPSTPFVTVARLAGPPGMSALELSGAIVVVLATTTALVWASGRIFRVGILMQGKSPNLGQLAKWVISG